MVDTLKYQNYFFDPDRLFNGVIVYRPGAYQLSANPFFNGRTDVDFLCY